MEYFGSVFGSELGNVFPVFPSFSRLALPEHGMNCFSSLGAHAISRDWSWTWGHIPDHEMAQLPI